MSIIELWRKLIQLALGNGQAIKPRQVSGGKCRGMKNNRQDQFPHSCLTDKTYTDRKNDQSIILSRFKDR